MQDKLALDDTIEEYEVWDIDLFDNDAVAIQELHRRGRKAIAYFSAGTYEDWRDDASKFEATDLGRKLDDWEGERWLQTNSANVREIMKARLDLARAKGFDGVDPDNVDAYDNKNGLHLKKTDAVDYLLFLANEAHIRGLAIGLKNAGDIVGEVLSAVQFSVQEQCMQYNDTESFFPFVQQNKPVFHVEYPKGDDAENPKMNNDKPVPRKQSEKIFASKKLGFSTIIKNAKLDQWVQTA